MGFAALMRRSYVNGGLGLKVETGERVGGDQNDVVGVFNITGEVMVTFLTAQVVLVTEDDTETIRVYHYNTQTTNSTYFSAVGVLANIAAGNLLQFPDLTTDVCTFVDAITPTTLIAAPQFFGFLGGFGLSSLMSTGQIRYIIETGDEAEGLLKWYLYYIPISWDGEVTPAF